MSIISIPPEWIPVGRAVYEDALSAAVELTDTPDAGDALPSNANCAIVYCSGQAVHWETDGTAATTAQPKYPTSNFLILDNQRTTLVKSSFLEAAASARLDIWYYMAPSG